MPLQIALHSEEVLILILPLNMMLVRNYINVFWSFDL